MSKLFIPFKRIYHLNKQYPGTGLGLSLCKNIVELHGGAIGIDSKLRMGSAVLFTLP